MGPRQVKIGGPFQQKTRRGAGLFFGCGSRIWGFFALLRRALPSLMGPGEVQLCIHCPDTPKAALLDGLWRIWLREPDHTEALTIGARNRFFPDVIRQSPTFANQVTFLICSLISSELGSESESVLRAMKVRNKPKVADEAQSAH